MIPCETSINRDVRNPVGRTFKITGPPSTRKGQTGYGKTESRQRLRWIDLLCDVESMIGGYLVGIAVGCLIGTINLTLDLDEASVAQAVTILSGAFATALAMFIMVVTKTEHPPAAALALGLVLNEWNLLTILVILAGIVSLSIFKRLILPMLMDLI